MATMKNVPLNNAVTDLGLGDDLQEQATQQFNARKKKLNQTAANTQASANTANNPNLQTAATSLGLGMGVGR